MNCQIDYIEEFIMGISREKDEGKQAADLLKAIENTEKIDVDKQQKSIQKNASRSCRKATSYSRNKKVLSTKVFETKN